MIKKWYFSINEAGFSATRDQINVAVRSARRHTSLTPVCIYSGQDFDHCAYLENLGVEVINHFPSFAAELKEGYGDNYDQFVGHWLRVDIPTIEIEEDFILYTDTDVMFTGNVNDLPLPKYLAAAPEFKIDNFSKFNSGVMVMNLNELRDVQDDFLQSIRSRLVDNYKYPAHDQESYNRFFAGRYDRLNPIYNWKPYWGENPDARIVHFHGPKLRHVARMENNRLDGISPSLIRLWKLAPGAYKKYMSDFRYYSSSQ